MEPLGYFTAMKQFSTPKFLKIHHEGICNDNFLLENRYRRRHTSHLRSSVPLLTPATMRRKNNSILPRFSSLRASPTISKMAER